MRAVQAVCIYKVELVWLIEGPINGNKLQTIHANLVILVVKIAMDPRIPSALCAIRAAIYSHHRLLTLV